MAHILTDEEALSALRAGSPDEVPNFKMLLSAVDDGLLTETGRNWTTDSTIDPTAKLAAMLLLISLNDGTPLPDSYRYKVVQLDAKAKAMAI